ncbi:MAG: cytochrome c peroxidase [Paracoccaceae bacterium]
MCIAQAATAQELGPPPVFAFPETAPDLASDMARIELGQLLFYDPVLSGNRNISCATCHHPRLGTADAVSLGIGEGGIGLGPERIADPTNHPEQRIPRNAPGLWNLGAAEFQVMFHDGRLEADATAPYGMRTPLGGEMLAGFDSVLSAQAMFPVLSSHEMAGHYSENEVSEAVRLSRINTADGAWERIAARVAAIPAYAALFAQVQPGEAIKFTDISNVIADFIAFEWRADNSAFDQFMRGEAQLAPAAERGLTLFYGKAGCASCHAGWFQTDHSFHAIAMPQIGPGKAAPFEGRVLDEGRMRVTGDPDDAYAFRTPSLRNVTLTAPYGHSGAYATLDGVIRHHLDPVASLYAYDPAQAMLPVLDAAQDWAVLENAAELARIAAANSQPPNALSDEEIADLIAFLEALSDPAERLGVPEAVPSGLPAQR